ncbi:Coiled-coil domain-containing protein 30 [Labeo rohita]|uniref:Coiled-coil domain-containing protein 30 n=1 Tax=Labeo rohita TaxID=84645 RepID=A0ABQ8M2K3_LABRO|nr:Coiled-coil domain-containing protein 30 [Labeo rohita]
MLPVESPRPRHEHRLNCTKQPHHKRKRLPHRARREGPFPGSGKLRKRCTGAVLAARGTSAAQTGAGRAAVPLLAASWSERYLKSRNDATLYTEAGAGTILSSSINANIISVPLC